MQPSIMLRPPVVQRRASGFSLVELMVSIAVGLVVLAGITTMFAHNVKAGGDAMKMARLNQELQATMSLMTRDIRRAGYWGKACCTIGNPDTTSCTIGNPDTTACPVGNPQNNNLFTLDTPSPNPGSCITFSYDRNGDGNVDVGSSGTSPANDPDERFGFRLRSGALETRQSGADCAAGGWDGITDTVTTEITGLTFELVTKNVDIGAATTSEIIVREVTITLSGQLRRDTAVSRTLRDKVRVHNDLYQL